MTDKEKKSKIADILLEFYEEYQCNMPNRPMIPSLYASKIINTMQEESVSVWHDASEEPEEGKQLVFSYKKQYYAGRIYKDEFGRTLAYDGKTAIELSLLDNWAYLDDLLNLDDSCNFGKNLQVIPVSEDLQLEIYNNNPKIIVGTKICLKTNPDVILSIISNDCHEDKFECSNGSVLSLKQIEKYYDIYIEEK